MTEKSAQYANMIYEKDGNVAYITFNRPEKLNVWPFVGGMVVEFHDALSQAEEDDDVKVVVLRGAGRSFSAGHDLSEVGFVYGMGTGNSDERRPSQRIRLKIDSQAMSNHKRIMLFPKITVCEIHGHCMGEGLILAEICDMAIAAEDATLAHSDQRMGFAGGGSHQIGTLIAHVGMKRAMDLLLTGRWITGKEAAQMGLITKAVPADQLRAEVDKLTKALCRMPRDGIAIGKAHRALTYEAMGLTVGFPLGTVTHTLFTNLRWEADEYNFFKHRRDDGVRSAIHSRDDRYEDLL